MMPVIEILSIQALNPLHDPTQCNIRRLNLNVKMICHQTDRMHCEAIHLLRILNNVQKTHIILHILEYILLPVPAAHHMINRPGIPYSPLSRQNIRLYSLILIYGFSCQKIEPSQVQVSFRILAASPSASA